MSFRRELFVPCVLTCLSIFLAGSVAHANSDQQNSSGWNWFESLQFNDIQLTGSADLPSDAEGWASLISWDDQSNGVTYGFLNVFTRQLPGGTYTVSMTQTSDSTEIELGTFTSDVYEFDEYDYEYGDGWFELPSGVTTADIAAVTIIDSGGNVVYSGDF